MGNQKNPINIFILIFFLVFTWSLHSQEENEEGEINNQQTENKKESDQKTKKTEPSNLEKKKAITAHIVKGEYANAILLLNALLKEEPKYTIGHNQLGYCNIMMNHPDDALKHYKKSDSISPNLDAKAGIQWALLVQGKNGDSIKAGEEALKMDPNNKWVKQRIEQAKKGGVYPTYYVNPSYSASEFHNSSLKGVGYDAGLNLSAVFNTRWAASIGYNKIYTNTLVPKYGYFMYMRDESHYSTYQYFTSTQNYIDYFTSPTYTSGFTNTSYNTNLQAFSSVASTSDYNMSDYSLGTSYSPSSKATYWINLHYLSSNDEYTKGAYSANIGGTWGAKNKFTASIGGISFPQHKGGQIALSYAWNVWKGLWSDTMVMGQAIGIQETSYEYTISTLFGSYYFTSASDTETASKSFGAIQQTFTYAFQWLSIGVGGRGGNAGYNPIFGNNLIVNPSLLKTGLFGTLNVYYFSRVTFNLTYSYDKWRNAVGESPSSKTATFSLTARF